MKGYGEMKRTHYERDDTTFPAHAYTVCGWRGTAFSILGWETEPDEDTEWSGVETRTGSVVAVMVGDHKRHLVDRADITALAREDYCGECGQIGCAHDGLVRC